MSAHIDDSKKIMLPHLVDIDSLTQHSHQLDGLVAMLCHYYDNKANGGDTLSDEVMSNFMWQMQTTMYELRETIAEISHSRVSPSADSSGR